MPENLSTSASGKRRFTPRIFAVVIAVIAVITVTAWLATAGGSRPASVTGAAAPGPDAPSSADKPTESSAPAPKPVTGELDTDTADVLLAGYFDAVDTLAAGDDLSGLATVVSGNAFEELEAQLLEFEAREWTVTGQTRYEDVEILESDLDATTPSALVSVCVDSSDVTVVGSDGSPVGPEIAGERRAINFYSLTYTDGAWRVDSHTFPDDPHC